MTRKEAAYTLRMYAAACARLGHILSKTNCDYAKDETFTCNITSRISPELGLEYAYVFGFCTSENLMGETSNNEHKLWKLPLPERQAHRALLLSFAAAMVETGDLGL